MTTDIRPHAAGALGTDAATDTAPSDAAAVDAAAPGPTGSRPAPYAAPKLRHLGSVRDLTLGTSNQATEFGMMNM